MPTSACRNVVISNIDVRCERFYNVGKSDRYRLSRFTFKNIAAECSDTTFCEDEIEMVETENVDLKPAGSPAGGRESAGEPE